MPKKIEFFFENRRTLMIIVNKRTWSILPRRNPLLKSAGDFPQIVSNRITRVKPIACFYQIG